MASLSSHAIELSTEASLPKLKEVRWNEFSFPITSSLSSLRFSKTRSLSFRYFFYISLLGTLRKQGILKDECPSIFSLF
jgi:hypothetical protein